MQNLSTEINDSGNEKEVLALVQTPIPAIDPMDTPSKTASASNYLTARQELETETKRGCNEKEIMLLDQSPIPAIDPMNTASRPPIAKQGTKSGENSSPLHNTPHTPNNEAIEDSNARPGAYHIPGIGADRQEDTNPMDMSFTATPAATPIANLVSSQRSMIHQFVVALPLRQTLVNFKDKRVQLLFFLIAVVIISLSLVLVLVLDNESPSRNNDGIRTQPFPSNQPNDRTTPNPSANNIHNRSAYPTCNPSAFPTYLPSAYPTYLPSGIPSKVMILSFSTAMEIFVPISGEESLKNETSPQYLAMDWIVNHDEANMALKDEDKIVQRYILAVLYYSTQGKNWNNQCNFLSEKDVCDWNEFTNSAIDDSIQFSGITRCDEAKNVENINLVNENLTGTIPSELGMLTKLTDLRLHSNNLFGTVPVILSNISSLGKVELMRNDLTGDMEAFCTNGIEYIWLSADCYDVGITARIECSCCDRCTPWFL